MREGKWRTSSGRVERRSSPGKEKEGKGEIRGGAREDERKAEEADSVLEIVKNEMRK